MGEHDRFQVERRTNRALTVEAGNGPGRWVESEPQEALAALDARLNPDHGSAGPLISVVNEDPVEHRSLIAFSEESDRSGADVAVEADESAWGEIRPTQF